MADPLLASVAPVRISAHDTWVGAPVITGDAAATVMHGLIAPRIEHRPDADRLVVEPRLAFVPFWRTSLVMADGRGVAMMVCARSDVPYIPALPTALGGSEALELSTDDVVRFTNAMSIVDDGAIVDADLPRARADQIAVGALGWMTRMEAHVETALFVLHPMWHFRQADDCELLVDARGGRIIMARMPRPPTHSDRANRFFGD